MSREYKFRGKTASGQWIYGDLTQIKDSGAFYIGEDNMSFEGVRSDTVGQYTGLKDKNDIDIYMGDIVEYKGKLYPIIEELGSYNLYDQSGELEEQGAICEYLLSLAHIYAECLDVDEDTLCNVEIKGNIHDNPELLKGGKK